MALSGHDYCILFFDNETTRILTDLIHIEDLELGTQNFTVYVYGQLGSEPVIEGGSSFFKRPTFLFLKNLVTVIRCLLLPVALHNAIVGK